MLNPGDLLTKHLTKERIDCYAGLIGYTFASGRSAATAALHSLGRLSLEKRSRPENKPWTCLSQTRWKGSFKSARALRSPTSIGIGWHEIEQITTHDQVTGRLIADFRPRRDQVSEAVATAAFGGCADIIVNVELAPVQKFEDTICAIHWIDKSDNGSLSGPIIRVKMLGVASRECPFAWIQQRKSKSNKCVRFINGSGGSLSSCLSVRSLVNSFGARVASTVNVPTKSPVVFGLVANEQTPFC